MQAANMIDSSNGQIEQMKTECVRYVTGLLQQYYITLAPTIVKEGESVTDVARTDVTKLTISISSDRRDDDWVIEGKGVKLGIYRRIGKMNKPEKRNVFNRAASLTLAEIMGASLRSEGHAASWGKYHLSLEFPELKDLHLALQPIAKKLDITTADRSPERR